MKPSAPNSPAAKPAPQPERRPDKDLQRYADRQLRPQPASPGYLTKG